ncbi:dehydrogenase, partial [Oryctes borbonicus]
MFVENKVAIITGGATGIGYLYAVELLKNGLRAAVLADVDAAKGNEAIAQLAADFGEDKVLFVETDVTDKNQVENVFKQTVKKYQNIDILINNAGILDESVWEKEIAINLNGTFYGCLLAMEEYLPKYRSGDEAIIVNISSIVAFAFFASIPVYTATKHAIIGLSKCLSAPEHYNSLQIRVLTICPGITNTALMTNLSKKMLNERYMDVLAIADTTREQPHQSPEDVAQALITV